MADDSEIYFLMPQQFISVLKEICRASFLTGIYEFKSELIVVLSHTLIMKTAVISPFISSFNGCT